MLDDELWAELLNNELGHVDAISSVSYELGSQPEDAQARLQVAVLRKLKGLRRLAITGVIETTPVGINVLKDASPLPRIISRSLSHFTSLESLAFFQLDFDGDQDSTSWLPPNLKSLELNLCSGEGDLFKQTSGSTWDLAIPVKELSIRNILHGRGSVEQGLLPLCLKAAATCCTDACIDCPLLLPPMPQPVDFLQIPTEALVTRKLRLVGLVAAFQGVDHPSLLRIVDMLSTFNRGSLSWLSLPVYDVFRVHPILHNLSMPSLVTLVLHNNPPFYLRNPARSSKDLYRHDVHLTLTSLLSASFPSLSTLSLIGFFDVTGVLELAFSTSKDLASHYMEFSALLAFLRWTQVVELRLKDTVRRAVTGECVFERKDVDAADWTPRFVKETVYTFR
ncbi:hypothetical protein P7C70_g1389, partial [Phenoliferia sp. Uapishka_3]